MEVYYGSNEKGTTIIYAPYYFAGMSLKARTVSGFRFRFDFPFLDRLAKSSPNLEDFALKGWNIKRVDVHNNFLDSLLSYVYEGNLEKAREEAYGIIEMIEGLVIHDYKRSLGYDDGYSEMDTQDEIKEDNWWDFGLPPPFLSDDVDWNQEDYQD